MAFTLAASDDSCMVHHQASLAMSYALNDYSISHWQTLIKLLALNQFRQLRAATTLNGVSVSVASANNSTWDVDLGYSAGGFALTYGVDETDAWTATATSALGGGATFAAGVASDNDSTVCRRIIRILIQTGFDEFKGHHYWCPFFINKEFYDFKCN